jgi:hypothetical protein
MVVIKKNKLETRIVKKAKRRILKFTKCFLTSLIFVRLFNIGFLKICPHLLKEIIAECKTHNWQKLNAYFIFNPSIQGGRGSLLVDSITRCDVGIFFDYGRVYILYIYPKDTTKERLTRVTCVVDAEKGTRSCRYWNCNGCHGERTASNPAALHCYFYFIHRPALMRWEWTSARAGGRPHQRKRAKLKVQSAGECLPLSSYLSLSACALLHRARFGTNAFYSHASPPVFFVLSRFCTHSRREICFLAKDRRILPRGGYRKNGWVEEFTYLILCQQIFVGREIGKRGGIFLVKVQASAIIKHRQSLLKYGNKINLVDWRLFIYSEDTLSTAREIWYTCSINFGC